MTDKDNAEICPADLLLDSSAYLLAFLLHKLGFFASKLLGGGDFPLEIDVLEGFIIVLSLLDESLAVETAARRLLVIDCMLG